MIHCVRMDALEVVLKSQYLFVICTKPFTANQNVKYECFHYVFQMFPIFVGCVWYVIYVQGYHTICMGRFWLMRIQTKLLLLWMILRSLMLVNEKLSCIKFGKTIVRFYSIPHKRPVMRKEFRKHEINLTDTMYTWWVSHDDVIKWKHFPRYWPFVRGIHRSPANSPHTKASEAELWCFLWSAPE